MILMNIKVNFSVKREAMGSLVHYNRLFSVATVPVVIGKCCIISIIRVTTCVPLCHCPHSHPDPHHSQRPIVESSLQLQLTF